LPTCTEEEAKEIEEQIIKQGGKLVFEAKDGKIIKNDL